MKSLDAMREEYGQMHTYSVALAQDDTNSAIEVARRQARRRVTRELAAAARRPAPRRPCRCRDGSCAGSRAGRAGS